jgi:hypothetical protein
LRIARRGSHRGAGNFFPNSTPDRFAQALFSSEQNYLAKIGLTIDFLCRDLDQSGIKGVGAGDFGLSQNMALQRSANFWAAKFAA